MGTTICGISKTTINGVLAAIIATAGPVTAYLAAIQGNHAATVAAGLVTLLATICRVWVGLLQGDAPTVPPAAKIILLAVLLIPFGVLGCKASTAPPTAPSVTALNVLQEVQSDVLAIQQAEISAVKAGLIDAATDAKLQSAFKQEAQDATALADAISTTASATTVQAKVTTLLNDIQQDVANGVAGIKDANTKAAITASISAAEISVNSIMAAYSAGK